MSEFRHLLWISLLPAVTCLVIAFTIDAGAVEEIKIGVIIRHRGLEDPLNRTLEMLNADTSVLFSTRLTAIVETIETDNSYLTSAAGKC